MDLLVEQLIQFTQNIEVVGLIRINGMVNSNDRSWFKFMGTYLIDLSFRFVRTGNCYMTWSTILQTQSVCPTSLLLSIWYVMSISIGLGPSLIVWIGFDGGAPTIQAYIWSPLVRKNCCRFERHSNSRLSHHIALLIAFLSDLGSSWKVKNKSFTSLRSPYRNESINTTSSQGIS
jgi:hypothetical protein